jgi:hypothetical protein
MKVKDLLIDSLIDTKLFEMAFAKKVAMDKARNLQNQVARHLIKIQMYAQSQYVQHWVNEVNSWLLDIQDDKLRGTNKPLPYRDLMLILFEEPLSTIDDIQYRMNRIYSEYSDLKIDEPDAAKINKSLSWILPQICKDIAASKFNNLNDYLEK